MPDIPGIDHPKVVSYNDLLSGKRNAGHRVAIVGAGGIGFDVAEYLCHSQPGEGPEGAGTGSCGVSSANGTSMPV